MIESVHTAPRTCEIRIDGTDLARMEEEARRQFEVAFNGREWELTAIDARLDMVSVGETAYEWLPGMWAATYTARERG